MICCSLKLEYAQSLAKNHLQEEYKTNFALESDRYQEKTRPDEKARIYTEHKHEKTYLNLKFVRRGRRHEM